ncbi:related to SQT1 Suppresses dominant-negative mutants of the ribosomal QSR1 [Lecanosticta acicola]|uniref:Related to SQT1 Suppresses dominant-negative mutants of the ribosomal QSR1 n=1 Tax=Lecanosticta acicola TaxID=111012 RepID=A0AAI8Z6T7_9PEZI|nr:related to SQT1 Suppresses dominant-negative mutants of the ribosomal QSR1 [Lecanosticta acicola]
MAERDPDPSQPDEHEDNDMLDPEEAEEIVSDDGDAAMDSGEENEETEQTIELINNSSAHFDQHKDSIFCIAQHPLRPEIVVTGGGDDIAYVWDTTPPEKPVLPGDWATDGQPRERRGNQVLARLEGQDESVNAVCFTLPKGEYVVTATLAGKMNVYSTQKNFKLAGSVKEVEEINWLAPCPNATYPNTVAFGANDGSVWVYTMGADGELSMVQTFFLHQGSCTAGAWTPDGKMLATVAEDCSLYVYDVFGDAAAAGITDPNGGQAVVGLTGEDERFRVEGGLYSVAISPGGGIVAVGGAEGHIRVVGLPRLSMPANSTAGAKGAGAKSKAGGSKQAGGPKPPTSATPASAGQAGQILAALQAQSDGVETLDFSQPPLTLLAAGSVDGSIALFDAAHNFAVRRQIREAHEEHPVIKVEFVKTPLGTSNPSGHVLTTCGNDGVIRRWDVRGGTAAAANGALGEWRGHRGGGEGGGIFGFVQGGGGRRVVTAGDDGISLVFDIDA